LIERKKNRSLLLENMGSKRWMTRKGKNKAFCKLRKATQQNRQKFVNCAIHATVFELQKLNTQHSVVGAISFAVR